VPNGSGSRRISSPLSPQRLNSVFLQSAERALDDLVFPWHVSPCPHGPVCGAQKRTPQQVADCKDLIGETGRIVKWYSILDQIRVPQTVEHWVFFGGITSFAAGPYCNKGCMWFGDMSCKTTHQFVAERRYLPGLLSASALPEIVGHRLMMSGLRPNCLRTLLVRAVHNSAKSLCMPPRRMCQNANQSSCGRSCRGDASALLEIRG